MESICIRLDGAVAKKVDALIKEFNYSTKTDFVRDAIRERVTRLEEEQTKREVKNLEKYFGKFKSAKSVSESNKAVRGSGLKYLKTLEKKFSKN